MPPPHPGDRGPGGGWVSRSGTVLRAAVRRQRGHSSAGPNWAAGPGPGPATRPSGAAVKAVLAGNIFKVHVAPGDRVEEGQPLLVVEAMKMETTVSAPKAGTIGDVFVGEGDVVAVGDPLVTIAG